MRILRLIRALRLIWFAFICLGVGVVGLQMGIHKKRNAAQYHTPIVLSYDDFVRRHPKAGWFRITGCTLIAPDAVYSSGDPKHFEEHEDGTGTITEAFVPVRRSEMEDAPGHLVVLTKDVALRKVLHEMQGLGLSETISTPEDSGDSSDSDAVSPEDKATPAPTDAASKQKLKQWIHTNADRIIVTRTVEGMIRSEEDMDSDQKKCVASLGPDVLVPGSPVLEEGVTPINDNGNVEIGFGTVALLIGGVLALSLLGTVLSAFSGKGASPSSATPTTYTPGYTPPVSGTPVRDSRDTPTVPHWSQQLDIDKD